MTEDNASQTEIDIQGSRRAIASMQLRMDPAFHDVRQDAIDEIVQNVMAGISATEAVPPIKVFEAVNGAFGFTAVPMSTIQESLERLAMQQIVEVDRGGSGANSDRFRLSAVALNDNRSHLQQSNDKLSEVTRKALGGRVSDPKVYEDALLEGMCAVVSEFSEESATLLGRNHYVLADVDLNSISNEIADHHSKIDGRILHGALERIFTENEGSFADFLFDIAQSYFLIRTFGGGDDGFLTGEIYKDVVFYFDTNVLINALAPSQNYFRAPFTRSFVEGCKALGIGLRVANVSLEEFRGVQIRVKNDLQTLPEYVPEGLQQQLAGHVTGFGEPAKIATLNMDRQFSEITDVRGEAKSSLGADVVEDVWFDTASRWPSTRVLADALSAGAKQRGLGKGANAALHDALMLFWIREKRQSGEKAFFVTADSLLPGFKVPGTEASNLVLPVHSVIQWVAPASGQQSRKDFARVFADVIRSRVLPQRRVMRLEDFRIFEQLQIDSKSLPDKDVLGCIDYIKTTVPGANPFNLNDMVRIARGVRAFFSDPGREYKQNVADLHQRLERAEQSFRDELAAEKQRFEQTHEEQRTAQDQAISEIRGQLKRVESELQTTKDDLRTSTLRRSAERRLTVSIVLTFLATAFAGLMFGISGPDSDRVLDRLLDHWWQLGTVLVATFGFLARFLIGGRRIKTLFPD